MKKVKVHSLTGRITPELMEQAFKAVKRNRGAAGVDKVSVNMFDANREDNLAALMRDLKGRTFQPRPLRRVYIPKGPGSTKLRPLGIPVVRDRVAQEVLLKTSCSDLRAYVSRQLVWVHTRPQLPPGDRAGLGTP